jgi:hypothetical protein
MVVNATFNNISAISWRLHSIAKIGYGCLFLGDIDLRYKTRSVCGSNYLLSSFRRANEFPSPRGCTSPLPFFHVQIRLNAIMLLAQGRRGRDGMN